MDSDFRMFSSHLYAQRLEWIVGRNANSSLPTISKSRIDNVVVLCWHPQYRSLRGAWTGLCPDIAMDRCAIQYVTRGAPDGLRHAF